LAIFDAFEILQRIEEEEAILTGRDKIDAAKIQSQRDFKGFAEGRSK
tara:strand:+ start:943 stop:1083 length:141 start_codon:yes stop_codon:yes gene_type:complete